MVFGIIFQLPLILMLLSRLGLISSKFLRKQRKYAYLLFFVFGAALTPPDPLTQSLMAVPLVLMYEISVVLTRVFGRKKAASTEEETREAV
jgi:sec-independent protein translocase protein TatC